MDGGSIRVWGLQALVLVPNCLLELQGCVKWFQKASTVYCRLLEAPAVKVKQRPRRGGGRHACPFCLSTGAR